MDPVQKVLYIFELYACIYCNIFISYIRFNFFFNMFNSKAIKISSNMAIYIKIYLELLIDLYLSRLITEAPYSFLDKLFLKETPISFDSF